MSMATLEKAILAELKKVANNPKLTKNNIMAWETGKSLKAEEGETLYYLPELGVSCAVQIATPKKK